MSNGNYGRVTAGLIGAWFLFALSASALNVFKNDSDRPAFSVGLAALTRSSCSCFGSRPRQDSGSSHSL